LVPEYIFPSSSGAATQQEGLSYKPFVDLINQAPKKDLKDIIRKEIKY